MTEVRSAQDCYFTDEETAACAEEAHKRGLRLCSHARARDSVTMCIKHGVDIIYHGSYIDEEGTSDCLARHAAIHIFELYGFPVSSRGRESCGVVGSTARMRTISIEQAILPLIDHVQNAAFILLAAFHLHLPNNHVCLQNWLSTLYLLHRCEYIFKR